MQLRGITWRHTRGYLPMVATAQRYFEMRPEVDILWELRSLREFGDSPVEKLAEDFDLLVIDHPFAGTAAAKGLVLPMDEHLDAGFLEDQRANAVGKSYESYFYGGHLWALAIDAATPVSFWRSDLLGRVGIAPPDTWDDVLAWAAKGAVVVPGSQVDTLMNFYMFCLARGEAPFRDGEFAVSEHVGVDALNMLRKLMDRCPRQCFGWNPIAVHEVMSSTDEFAYCPFAYAYSNYARPGYGQRRLEFGDLPSFDGTGRGATTLGGAGLAISARTRHQQEAVNYTRYVASAECQRGIYFWSGGQPGHRQAWVDEEVNRASGGFFRKTLPALDRAYLRPRYEGYLDFQERAARVTQDFLVNGGDARRAMGEMRAIFEQTRPVSSLRPDESYETP